MFKETLNVKVTIIGNANVGKSSIIHRFIKDEYLEKSEPTIGANFLSRIMEFQNSFIKLNIWDTAGQERYLSIAASYTRNSQVCILTYDITNLQSFKALSTWYDLIKPNLDSDCIIIIIGNKEDLIDNEEVSLNTAKEFCAKFDFPHFRVSAKSGEGILNVFNEVCKLLSQPGALTQISTSKPEGFNLTTSSPERSKRKRCCK